MADTSYTELSESDKKSWKDNLKPLLYYDTIGLVTVHSVKLGSFHRSIQIIIFLYIVVYSVWVKEGYNAYSKVSGVVFTKMKGTGYVNEGSSLRIYDPSDLVVPPTEPNAMFIVTAMIVTNQQRDGICTTPQAIYNCTKNEDCKPTPTPLGEVLPTCNLTQGGTSGYCLLRGWCPIEEDSTKDAFTIQGLEDWTLFLRSSVVYESFKVVVEDSPTPVPGINLFVLNDTLNGFNVQNCSLVGCIVLIDIDWTCNLDHGNCEPTTTFFRYPDGFNYRKVIYNLDQSQRQLEKFYGIRFLISITGIGSRFSVISTVITVGSGVTFFAVATLITDFVLLIVFSKFGVEIKKYDQYEPDDGTKGYQRE